MLRPRWSRTAKYRYDVLFVKPPMTTEAMEQVSTKPGIDEAHAGKHAIYFEMARRGFRDGASPFGTGTPR